MKRKSDITEDRPVKQQRVNTDEAQKPVPIAFGRIPPYKSPSFSTLSSPNLYPKPPPIQDEAMASAVFTHSSVVDGKYSASAQSTYEQLEFYGDAAMELIATRLIFHNFPTLLTGKQSTLRQNLVNNKTLAKFSRRYEFPEALRCTQALRESPQWEKACADVFEAYVAAVVLSSPDGFHTAEKWLTELWKPFLPQEQAKRIGIDRNYKDELQRKIGGYGIVIKYEKINDPVLEAAAAKGGQKLKFGVYLTGWGLQKQELGQAVGIGKTEAGMLAAKDALERSDGMLEQIVETKRTHDEKRRAEKEAAASSAEQL